MTDTAQTGADVRENGMLAGLVLRDTFTGELREQAASGLFVAIGHDPRTELFTGQLKLDAERYLAALADHQPALAPVA